jgi:hypothetical protein
MRSARIFLARLSLYLYFRLYIMCGWSWIYRRTWERRWRYYPLPLYRTMNAVVADVDQMHWTADGWRQLWDAISWPNAVWGRLRTGNPKVGDCDEFAIFQANVIRNSVRKGCFEPDRPDMKIMSTFLLTVCWVDKNGKMSGHNVCLLYRRASAEWHGSDPTPGAPIDWCGYMDYGQPQWFDRLESVVTAIRLRYAGPGNQSLGYAVSDPGTLKPLAVYWR